MLQFKWLVGLSLMLGLSVLLGTQLFGQTKSPVESPSETEITSEEPRRVSDAERRFLNAQPRHWRQMMIRR